MYIIIFNEFKIFCITVHVLEMRMYRLIINVRLYN